MSSFLMSLVSTLMSCPGCCFFICFIVVSRRQESFPQYKHSYFMASGACLAVLCLDRFPAEAKVLLQVVHVRWLVFIGLNLVLLAFLFGVCGSMLLLF